MKIISGFFLRHQKPLIKKKEEEAVERRRHLVALHVPLLPPPSDSWGCSFPVRSAGPPCPLPRHTSNHRYVRREGTCIDVVYVYVCLLAYLFLLASFFCTAFETKDRCFFLPVLHWDRNADGIKLFVVSRWVDLTGGTFCVTSRRGSAVFRSSEYSSNSNVWVKSKVWCGTREEKLFFSFFIELSFENSLGES